MARGITRRALLKAGLAAAGGAAAGPLLGSMAPISSVLADAKSVLPWPAAREIVAKTVLPRFRPHSFLATAYGAVGDGTTDNTAAFKRAIVHCNARGGGHVVVPPGVYSTGAIHLLSGVDFHLKAGAVLKFNGNAAGYPLVLTRYEGIECINRSPMVYAYGQTNIGLTGSGILDASGTGSWNVGSNRMGVLDPLVAAGLPPQKRIVPDHGQLRSTFVEPYACDKVLIQGITLRQAQFWQLHPTRCRNVTVDGVTTGGTKNPNTDGCNPESCDHVVIKNCTLDANDDCIAIKSGRDADGRRVNIPSQNIVIAGCRLQGPMGGVTCGSEMSGGIRNVYAYNIQTYGTSIGYALYVKANTARGGFAENINLDHIRADGLHWGWAYAQMDYGKQAGDFPPIFSGWNISNASGDSNPWVFRLSGLLDNPITHFHVRDSVFTNIADAVDEYANVTDVRFRHVSINGKPAMS